MDHPGVILVTGDLGDPLDQYQAGETGLIQRIDSDITNMNTISKSFTAIPWKFKCPLIYPVHNNK